MSSRNPINEAKEKFLNLREKPARIMAEQVAWLINCAEHDIPILVKARVLKPLGKPAKNGPKYFFTAEVQQCIADRSWMDKAYEITRRHWEAHNAKKANRVASKAESVTSESSQVAGRA